MKKTVISTFILFIIFNFFSVKLSLGQEDDFNPAYIISDGEFLDSDCFSIDDIQSFLESKKSYLATYETLNAYGKTKKASEIIYEAAYKNFDCDDVDLSDNPTEEERSDKCKKISTINPKILLVLLQKEQSLIENSNPTQKQLDWATGYGCPDSLACNPYYKGFGKQVNSAALQFLAYMQTPTRYPYQANQTYTFRNQYSTIKNETTTVTILNQATASLYNYTPHVYNGNYNFWKLWRRYFSKSYPNGSLLRADGETGVWLIENGQKRPFLTRTALISRYNPNKIITVNKSDLNNYIKGSPIKFAQYSIVKGPNNLKYLIVDNKKRQIADDETFRKLGYNPEEVINASLEDLDVYMDSEPITMATAYPMGALLQSKKTGGIFFVIDNTKAPLWDKVLLKTKYNGKKITPVNDEVLNKYATIDPVKLDDGELIKTNSSSAVYVIEDGKIKPITSGKIFETLGYKWTNVITISNKLLSLYEIGEPIKIN